MSIDHVLLKHTETCMHFIKIFTADVQINGKKMRLIKLRLMAHSTNTGIHHIKSFWANACISMVP